MLTPVIHGDTVRSGTRIGLLRFTAPCEVVAVDEQDRVWLEVAAFSRPGRGFSTLGGPVARLVQRRITDGYLRAVQEAVRT